MSKSSSSTDIALNDERVSISPVGMTLAGVMSYDEWASIGPSLVTLNRATKWAIGDWINAGELRFSDRYIQAVTDTGLAIEYLRNIAWVCRQVPISLRREGVGFSIHQEVAPLSPDEQEQWLDWVVANDATRLDLRKAIAATKASEGDDTKPETAPISRDKLIALCWDIVRAYRSNKAELLAQAIREVENQIKEIQDGDDS